MPNTNRVYTAADLVAIKRRVRIVLDDGRRLGPRVVTPRPDGNVDAVLLDMPRGVVVTAILIDRSPLDIDGIPFACNGGNLSIGITPQSLGLVKVDRRKLRSLN